MWLIKNQCLLICYLSRANFSLFGLITRYDNGCVGISANAAWICFLLSDILKSLQARSDMADLESTYRWDSLLMQNPQIRMGRSKGHRRGGAEIQLTIICAERFWVAGIENPRWVSKAPSLVSKSQGVIFKTQLGELMERMRGEEVEYRFPEAYSARCQRKSHYNEHFLCQVDSHEILTATFPMPQSTAAQRRARCWLLRWFQMRSCLEREVVKQVKSRVERDIMKRLNDLFWVHIMTPRPDHGCYLFRGIHESGH